MFAQSSSIADPSRTFVTNKVKVSSADKTDLGTFSTNGRFFGAANAAKSVKGGKRRFAACASQLFHNYESGHPEDPETGLHSSTPNSLKWQLSTQCCAAVRSPALPLSDRVHQPETEQKAASSFPALRCPARWHAGRYRAAAIWAGAGRVRRMRHPARPDFL